MHHAAFVVGLNGKTSARGRKVPSGVLLPAITLATDLADFDATVAFVDRAEGRSGFDGLELLRVANQDNFRAGIGGMGIHLMRRFAQDMAYERVDGANRLTLRLDRNRAAD
jgi:hypothetical protein